VLISRAATVSAGDGLLEHARSFLPCGPMMSSGRGAEERAMEAEG